MHIINSFHNIPDVFENGAFSMERWEKYAAAIHPDLAKLCQDDMNEVLSTCQVTWEGNFLPVLNNVIADSEVREAAHESFLAAVNGLEQKITSVFGRTPDIEIIFYIGLCSGAGWVTEMGGKEVILLGLEKIMELKWHDLDSMLRLIYHELGHVYQAQFGNWESEFDSGKQSFLWQLFTEGIARVFEQEVTGQPEPSDQDEKNEKLWCDEHFHEILRDFTADLPTLELANQRWFGDWVSYCGHSDVGYYLGCRFVRFLLESYDFNDIICFEIDRVESLYDQFCQKYA